MAFFAYEKDFAGRFNPVVYFDKPLSHSVNGLQPERTQLHEIGEEFLGEDLVSPNFGKLKAAYPLGGN